MGNRLAPAFIFMLLLMVPDVMAKAPLPTAALFGYDTNGIPPSEVRFEPDESLPTPIVAIQNLIYRLAADHKDWFWDDCLLAITVTLPGGSAISTSDIGYIFKVVSGSKPQRLTFPDLPVRSLYIAGERSSFPFYWQEKPSDQHEPLDFILEVSVLTKDRRVGPPARIRISG